MACLNSKVAAQVQHEEHCSVYTAVFYSARFFASVDWHLLFSGLPWEQLRNKLSAGLW